MKKTLLLAAALLGQTLGVCAQVPRTHLFAFGVEGAAYNWDSQPAQPHFQAFSGVMFRYVPQRLGWRGGVALSQRVVTDNTDNCADCLLGQTSYRILTLRAGGQYVALAQMPWLYGFLDVAYRNSSADGRYTGGFCGCLDNTVTQITHSIGAMAGVGASFQIMPRIFIGPELYYESFLGHTVSSTTDNYFGQQTTRRRRATEGSPAVRVQAVVAF